MNIYTIEKAIDENDKKFGWHLFINGDWHNTYNTKAEAQRKAKYLKSVEL